MKALTKTRNQERTTENTQAGLDAASTTTIAVMGGVSALVGLWALACLVSAMIDSGGLLPVIRGWLHAVGM
jgi:hypothetical protein